MVTPRRAAAGAARGGTPRRAIGNRLGGHRAQGPTVALAAAKRVIDDGFDEPLAAGVEMETRRFAELFATEDQRVGLTSFLADGPGKATFVGR